MIKYLKLILFFVIISSCTKKDVQLPKLGEKGLTGIFNTSKVWIFYKIENNDTIAVMNKNNKVMNTDLIFNIDKRLSLKKVIPKIHKIQEKLNEKSLHKIEGMKNYYSYADTASKIFSLIDFTKTTYLFKQDEFDKYYNQIKNDSTKQTEILNIKKNNLNILMGELESKYKNDTINDISLLLKFDENLTYQNYLFIKTKLVNSKFLIEESEYIYTQE